MKRIIKANKGCAKLSSNSTFFYDIWFSALKIEGEDMFEGVDYCGPVNTSNKGFFLAVLEKLMKEGSGGSHMFISSTTRDPDDRPLMAIGYKYIYQKVLGFIFKEGAGSIVTCVPYLSFYLEDYSNVSIYFVEFTEIPA